MRGSTRTHCNTIQQQPRGCLLARFTGAPRQACTTPSRGARRARNEHARNRAIVSVVRARSRYAITHLTASGVKYSNQLLLMY